jgi:lipopolysaccharide export system ATP-binding protein
MSSLKVLKSDTGLHVTGLRKSFKKRVVIQDISLELRRGEVVALLGPNGSGKTTTFYSIAGLISSDGGQVKIDGLDVTTMPMYRRARMGLAYLPQETSIFRGLNVEENINCILDISTPLKSERKAKLEKLLSDFRIEHLRRTPSLALSGGERRRVEIARALATDPKYILLDEPFAGVDPISINDVRNLVSDLKSRNIGVLITDHNVRDTLKIVDRAYILHDGRVIISGLPEDVINNDNVRRVYLGKDFNIL